MGKGDLKGGRPLVELWQAPKSPMVYGLCLDDGVIRYVGMTQNAYSRFRAYRSPRFKGNDALLAWLKDNADRIFFVCLHSGSDGLADAEKRWIKKLRDQCFNIVGGGVQSWRVNDRKPWTAGRGILPPSAWVVARFARAKDWDGWKKAQAIRDEAIGGMTDAQRCAYELAIAKEHREIIPTRHQKWIEACADRMSACMQTEAAHG
jgi:hypothetical protein